jgi:hypothetical protein
MNIPLSEKKEHPFFLREKAEMRGYEIKPSPDLIPSPPPPPG